MPSNILQTFSFIAPFHFCFSTISYFFSKLATKYTQDDEKLRKNIEKLSDEIDKCKKDKSKSAIIVQQATSVIDNNGGQTNINIHTKPDNLPF